MIIDVSMHRKFSWTHCGDLFSAVRF